MHIGTGEYYRDSNGVRSIDKVMSGYIQGVCVDFTSETKESCERATKGAAPWFAYSENFPRRLENKDNRAGIRASFGPPIARDDKAALWCVRGNWSGWARRSPRTSGRATAWCA